jgi:hypothetical protein
MDSSQAFFCRDLWTIAAREGLKDPTIGNGGVGKIVPPAPPPHEPVMEEEENVGKGLKRKRKASKRGVRKRNDLGDGEESEGEKVVEHESENHQILEPEGEEGEVEAIEKAEEREREKKGEEDSDGVEGIEKVVGEKVVEKAREVGEGEEGGEKDFPSNHKEDLSFRPQKDTGGGSGNADSESDANRGSDYDAVPEEDDLAVEKEDDGKTDWESGTYFVRLFAPSALHTLGDPVPDSHFPFYAHFSVSYHSFGSASPLTYFSPSTLL